MSTLTAYVLESLLIDCSVAAQFKRPVPVKVEHLRELIELARQHVRGETLAEIHIPGFLPRINLNSRGHWASKASQIKKERELVGLALLAGARDLRGKHERVGRVAMTRMSARMLDDDNCVGSLKATRDAVAEWLGIDDGDRRISWSSGQEKTTRKGRGLVIRIEGRVERREG
jgi:hypothetical protein